MRVAIRTCDQADTISLGERLGAMLQPGDVVALTGELGAGKTTLTKGIARGAGIEAEVFSPTFTLIHEHPGKLPFYHIDLYRIESEDLLPDLGLDEYLYGQGITVIEWSERMGSLLPDTALQIRLAVADETERDIELTASYHRWDEVIQELAKYADSRP
ncbi:MAG: tRNA (adenosine(37)-N6)-threonylcarbamoyltransferase complex ATPase subunit type 1 TsaE [Armatimonadota bacterium]|nr:tRNA (adenosine(37)-N6)-threonylcarbamoyltransferase complex ATPase subunit type 1 TsaE [Armatimonadota bacterium]